MARLPILALQNKRDPSGEPSGPRVDLGVGRWAVLPSGNGGGVPYESTGSVALQNSPAHFLGGPESTAAWRGVARTPHQAVWTKSVRKPLPPTIRPYTADCATGIHYRPAFGPELTPLEARVSVFRNGADPLHQTRGRTPARRNYPAAPDGGIRRQRQAARRDLAGPEFTKLSVSHTLQGLKPAAPAQSVEEQPRRVRLATREAARSRRQSSAIRDKRFLGTAAPLVAADGKDRQSA